MLTCELRVRSDGRDISLESFANMVASMVQNRIVPLLKPPRRSDQIGIALDVVTIRRATKLLGLSRSTIWKLIKEKRVETVHIGRRTLLRMESIRKILE